jgi:hypothetical protein
LQLELAQRSASPTKNGDIELQHVASIAAPASLQRIRSVEEDAKLQARTPSRYVTARGHHTASASDINARGSTQRIVQVSIIAGLAGEHDMQPLLSCAPAALRDFAASRAFYGLLIAHICLIVTVMLLRSTLGLLVSAVGTAYCLLEFSLQFVLLTMVMRRRLLVQLMKSFELGYVLCATLVMIICNLRLDLEPSGSDSGYFAAKSYGWTVETRAAFALYALERVSFNAIAALAILLNLSTGTVPNFPPRVFQLCQFVILAGFVEDYVNDWQQRSDPDYPLLPFSFLFLDTTVRGVAYSAELAATFFLVKQLLKSLLMPQYSQLLHPRYKIREYPSPSLASAVVGARSLDRAAVAVTVGEGRNPMQTR